MTILRLALFKPSSIGTTAYTCGEALVFIERRDGYGSGFSNWLIPAGAKRAVVTADKWIRGLVNGVRPQLSRRASSQPMPFALTMRWPSLLEVAMAAPLLSIQAQVSLACPQNVHMTWRAWLSLNLSQDQLLLFLKQVGLPCTIEWQQALFKLQTCVCVCGFVDWKPILT